jgi:hypothetical protein
MSTLKRKLPVAEIALKPLLADDTRIVHLKDFFYDTKCTRVAKSLFKVLTQHTDVLPPEPAFVKYANIREMYVKTTDQLAIWDNTTLEQYYQNVLTPFTRKAFETSDFNLQAPLSESVGLISGFNMSLLLLAMTDKISANALRRETYRFLVSVLDNYVERMRIINWYSTFTEGVHGIAAEVHWLNDPKNIGISSKQLGRTLSSAYSHLMILDTCHAVREQLLDSPAGISAVERRLFKLKDFKDTDPLERMISTRLLNNELT